MHTDNISTTRDEVQRSVHREKLKYADIPWAFVPQRFLLLPPIAHRRHTDERYRRYLATPFEFAVGVSLLTAAKITNGLRIHEQAWDAGGKTGKKFKRDNDRHHEKCRQVANMKRNGIEAQFPKSRKSESEKAADKLFYLKNRRPRPLGPKLASKMSEANRLFKKKLRSQKLTPDTVVEISRRALLVSVGLQADRTNYRQLEAALNRLLKPIGRSLSRLSPILLNWEPMADGRLQMTVSGEWLNKSFVKVPLPLPVKTPTVLALYLFLHGIRTNHMNKTGIGLKWLCQRLGLTTHRGVKAATEVINDALELVNNHLEKQKVRTVERYETNDDDDAAAGQIRFQAIPLQQRDIELEEEEIEVEEIELLSCTRFRRHRVRCFMEQEVRHGETAVYAGVQA
jgi:hypothetical protein